MMATNTMRLARKWGRHIRNTISSQPDLFTTRISSDSAAQEQWTTTADGEFIAIGVGGQPAGLGANLLITDDPIGARREANSETYRENVWDWWRGTIFTRLEPGGKAVVMHTRWNEDDLIGRILADEGMGLSRCKVISLPAIAEEDEDVDGWTRKKGEALWPERWPIEKLERRRAAVGRFEWAAQYQQRPTPLGGAVFRRQDFRYFRYGVDWYELVQGDGTVKRLPFSDCWLAQTCDTAITAKTTSNYTVCTTFAVGPDHELLVIDVARAKLEVPDQIAWLLQQRAKWPSVRWQGIEPKASGKGILQQARRTGHPFRELSGSEVDKVTRASPVSVMYENGMVYHKAGADWLDACESELLAFPNGKHDDQVDTISYAGRECGASELQVFLV